MGGIGRWLAALGVGATLGALASWADWYAGRPPFGDIPRAADLVLNAGSVWAITAIFGGWLVTRMRGAWLAGVLTLASAVASYYAYGNFAGDRLGYGLTTLSGVLRFWLMASVVVGPVLGSIGGLARRADRWGVAARLVPSGGVLAEVALVRGIGRAGDAAGNTAMLVLAAAAVAWAAVVIVRHTMRRPTESR